MDEYYNIRRLALILAIQAEIEGMKVENLVRQQSDYAPAYSDQHFKDKAEELRSMAYAHNEQL
jgi:hypothetical protein